MKRTSLRIAQYLGLAACLVVILLQPATAPFALTNLAVQLALFLGVAGIPAYRTGMMYFVDGAWPWGLIAIGIQTLIFGGLDSPLSIAVAVIYVVVGARMSIWAVKVLFSGTLTEDLPRYRYKRRRWDRKGFHSAKLSIQNEILMRGLGNASYLALPAILVATDSGGAAFGPFAWAALGLWAVSWGLETFVDLQKARFGARCARQATERTCDVGLWRYSRHPNYFFQWMQWNALALLAFPALWSRYEQVGFTLSALTAVCLLVISGLMLYTLVHLSSATPAEYYSRLSRSYAAYQRITNKFFPGPRRRISSLRGSSTEVRSSRRPRS